MPPRACVIGWPIAHSRSPLIHGRWLREFKLAGSYERVSIAPDRIDEFLSTFCKHDGYVGCNVTIPHKEAAFAALDHTDETTRALGAANTLWVANGALHGTNTDVYGFLSNLDAGAPGWADAPGTAVMLGAGGASRAIVYGMRQRGFERILIANRTRARADELAQRFGCEGLDWSELPAALRDVDLLVNATSLGMTGQAPLEIDLSPLPGRAVVTDIVYSPLITPLLEQAAARGLRTVEGLGMLLHQAVPGFELWFGRRPTVDQALYDLIAADVTKGKS